MMIEQKAKAYDKALKRAKGIHSFSSDIAEIKRMEQIFPELSESEDEKIRKELIQFIKNWKDHNNIGRPHDFPTLTRNVEQCDRYIAWLEKQKEFVSADFDDVWDTADCDELTAPLEQYSKDAIKEMCHAWYDKGIELERKSWLEKQGEQRSKLVGFDYNANDSDLQEVTYFIPNGFHAEIDGNKVVIKRGEKKTADKVEPKFHEGDWVVYKNDICQIVKREEGCNKLVTVFGIEKELVNERNLSSARLWTIQDAKDGDVLASKNGDNILIFRNLDTNTSFSSYYNIAGIGELGWSNNRFIPATKEQRGQLEKAMTDAGYTFDFEKKELRKIEQKPDWSEEDEKIALSIEHVMNCASLLNIVPDKIDKIRAWLKSLKQKMEEQQ